MPFLSFATAEEPAPVIENGDLALSNALIHALFLSTGGVLNANWPAAAMLQPAPIRVPARPLTAELPGVER